MRHRHEHRGGSTVLNDLGVIALSVLIAVLLVRTGVLLNFLTSTEGMGAVGAFVAGMFFTSLFTTAPAIATLAEISILHGIFATALIGAVGSALGDLIIFRFVRKRLTTHLSELVTHQSVWRRHRLLLRRRYFRWITFLVGGFILASPLPDELGITVLGFSRIRVKYFFVLSFAFNFLGILAIGFIARTLAH